MNVILLPPSKFLVNRQYGAEIAKNRFSRWRLSAILDFLWCHHSASGNCILCS